METTKENVKHPSHYNQGGIECFDVIKAALGEDGFQAFCHGNAIKYTFRAKYKGKYIEDMKKARFYIDQIIEKIAKRIKKVAEKFCGIKIMRTFAS